MKIRRAAIALIIVSLGAFSASALAAKGNVGSSLSIKLDRSGTTDRFFGKVRSDASACEQGRKLKLLHRPVKQNVRWSVVAELRANGTGAWSYRPKRNPNGDRLATPGNWHVKATQVSKGSITCKDKFSSSLFAG
jgi:hypothetical protein